MCVCVCVCACARARAKYNVASFERPLKTTWNFRRFSDLCVCVCVCSRARARACARALSTRLPRSSDRSLTSEIVG